jgi:hypothetical protein
MSASAVGIAIATEVPMAKPKRTGRSDDAAGYNLAALARAANVWTIELLPLFATERAIGAALLGAERAQEWVHIAPLLEARGLPQIDQLMGGRYVPAVRAFFDHQYGLDRAGDAPLAPDGVENFEKWKAK